MHSGYHFVDLFAWIAQVNFSLERIRPQTAKIFTARFTPNDLFHQIDEEVCTKLFDQQTIRDFYTIYRRENYEKHGELDAYTLVQLMCGQNVVMTGSINLQQNSFSKRGWFDLPKDTYKGNGRIRHERVNIQVSHFLNMQVHSYQACGEDVEKIPSGSVGSEDHFDILIFRNKKMIGGEDFVKISLGKEMREQHQNDTYYFGHNEKAREATLLHFIEGKDDESEFEHHKFTNQLLSNIYGSIAQEVNTGNAQVVFSL